MVRLLLIVCSLHGSACHRIDPMLAAMPDLTCNIQQMMLADVWAQRNPELLRGLRIARTMCVPVEQIQVPT